VGRRLDLGPGRLPTPEVGDEDVYEPAAEQHGHDGQAQRALGRRGDHHHPLPIETQCGPSASCPVVLVPIGGPRMMVPVSTLTLPPSILTGNRSRPRGAGPPFFSPTRLYFEPWHGHSNHCDTLHHGTRQPRCTHFWYSATTPCSMPGRIAATSGPFLARGQSCAG